MEKITCHLQLVVKTAGSKIQCKFKGKNNYGYINNNLFFVELHSHCDNQLKRLKM